MPSTLWVDTVFNTDVAVGAQNLTSLMTGVSSTETRFMGMTLLRTIIGLDIAPTVHDQGEGSSLVSVGIGVTSQEAFAAGVFPAPRTATDKPPRGWVFRTQELVTQNGVGTPIVTSFKADIRGARKVENGELYLIVDGTFETGATFAVNVFALIRTLYKL